MVAPTLVALGPTSSTTATDDPSPQTSVVVAMLAFAGGVIHAAVIRHHLAYVAVATGFAAMAATQWRFAVGMLRRPTNRVRLLGVGLHGMIVATWLLSRTVGLPNVAGAEEPAPVGVADVTANLYSLVVVAMLARSWRSTRRGPGRWYCGDALDRSSDSSLSARSSPPCLLCWPTMTTPVTSFPRNTTRSTTAITTTAATMVDRRTRGA